MRDLRAAIDATGLPPGAEPGTSAASPT